MKAYVCDGCEDVAPIPDDDSADIGPADGWVVVKAFQVGGRGKQAGGTLHLCRGCQQRWWDKITILRLLFGL